MHGLRQSAMSSDSSVVRPAIASSRTSDNTLGEGFQRGSISVRALQTGCAVSLHAHSCKRAPYPFVHELTSMVDVPDNFAIWPLGISSFPRSA